MAKISASAVAAVILFLSSAPDAGGQVRTTHVSTRSTAPISAGQVMWRDTYRKYDYMPRGSFSIKLDNKGEKLFIVWNGAFAEPDAKNKFQAFGHCSVMVVTIPESERIE